MRKSLRVFCEENGMEYLRDQWDQEKNRDLVFTDVSYGSKKNVWWRCEKGHEWQAQIKSRTQGTDCPVCKNRALVPGQNDFAAMYPEIANQWHKGKNGTLTPDQFFPGSRKKVWWHCEKGHEWQSSIGSRTTMGTGCPVCAGKVIIPGDNDLVSTFPAVAAQWHPTKNGKWGPKDVSTFSNRRVWWQCELGHEWQTSVARRTSSGAGCPFCTGRKVLEGFNDLATTCPKVAKQWHPTLNEGLTPQMVTSGSHKKVWWECPVGHIWKAVVYSRAGTQECGCPVCAGRTNKDWQRRYAEAEQNGRGNSG